MLTIKYGAGSISNICTEIRRLWKDAAADEDFLAFARSIVADSPYDANDQLKTILEYAMSNIHYQADPEQGELLTAPRKMMENIQKGVAFGDCDDMAIFCVAVCRALGYDAWMVLLDQSGGGYNHAACEVYSEEKIRYMDPTIKENPLGVDLEPGKEYMPRYVTKLEVR